MNLHINLFVEGANPGATQPVEVEPLDSGAYRVLYSPGLVEGVAAGDVIRVTDDELGHFEVLQRGGNVCVKWAASASIGESLVEADELLKPLGARRDGSIERAAVWTIPIAVGLSEIESAMASIIALHPGSEWWFGNVYDSDNRPLDWWT